MNVTLIKVNYHRWVNGSLDWLEMKYMHDMAIHLKMKNLEDIF